MATLLSAGLLLTACATPGATASSTTDTSCANTVALADISRVDNPRNVTGEASACMTDTAIEPVVSSAQPQLPVTVVDNQGTEVTITDASRILALDMSGTLAATVFALGLGDNVVGRDTSTGFAQAVDLPLVTQNGHQLNGEAILELNPSVIITDSSIGPWDVVLQMRATGIPVVVVTPDRTIDNAGDIVDAVAAALGVPEEGAKLKQRIDAEISQVTSQIEQIVPADPAERLRMMVLYVRGNAGIYYIFGEGSGADSLIEALGGVDVASDIGWTGMRPMTAEALVKAQPDLILMMTKGLESVDGVDGLLQRIPAVGETPAGQNRRIVDMSDDEILSFGPQSSKVLESLARAIYGTAS